jgi:hypothetical protein
MYGASGGLQSTGAQQLNQGDAGGAPAKNEHFGRALAAGDFNADGRVDLAVGTPGERHGFDKNVGVVNIFYGSPTGLKSAGAQQFSQHELNGAQEAGDQFGSELAAGDFDGDHRADLAVSAPFEDVPLSSGGPAIQDVGNVTVIYGTPNGLRSAGSQILRKKPTGTEINDAGGHFGDALAAGDFNGDGRASLAVGVPDDFGTPANESDFKTPRGAGLVVVFDGAITGLATRKGVHYLRQNFGGSRPEEDDSFGSALATGDFNADGRADLAAAALGEDKTAGSVAVIRGSKTGLLITYCYFDETAFGAASTPGDRFGFSLAAGNFDHTGGTDLAVGVPQHDLPGADRAGVVAIFRGSAAKLLDRQHGEMLTQADGGGLVEANDQFGSSLSAGAFNRARGVDLVVGTPLEAVNPGPVLFAGVVNVLYGSGSSFTGKQFNQQAAGGPVEEGDDFGDALP